MASPDKRKVRFSNRLPHVAGATSKVELSIIDQKWGRLFDNKGTPTKRLGQFLRGLANYIIRDFQPKESIVVTPAKMATFYADFDLEKEPQPLLLIFQANSNEKHLQRLYQSLGCEHHLVQEHSLSEAIIPSLTPVGFARWITLSILAYPGEEWKRLEKVVMNMPIDADGDLVDGRPERLPKQISRHLLPEKTDATSQQLLEGAILQFLADFGGAPSNSECSSNEEGIKIERDRQPYTARPGRGKVYVERRDGRYLGDRQYSGRGTDPNQVLFKGENSRKDTEKWDRYKGSHYKHPVHIIDSRGKRGAE